MDAGLPILVVDDHATIVRILKNLLKQIGFTNVEEAQDGGLALTRMREKPFGLVISDWYMEPMSGLELVREMRKDEMLKETPFIMVSAESKGDKVMVAKGAGVDNYIVKPFNAVTLKSKIAAVLGD
ncbi:MAG TPA: response regulator [Caulobacterales bacterium]|nr:response regulator [Caulobacterales bacterium]